MDQPESKLNLSDNFVHTSHIKFLLNQLSAFGIETQRQNYPQSETT